MQSQSQMMLVATWILESETSNIVYTFWKGLLADIKYLLSQSG